MFQKSILKGRARKNHYTSPGPSFHVVETQIGSWSTLSGTGPIAFTNTVQAGDFVVVSMSASTGSTVTVNIDDSNSTVYSNPALSRGSNGLLAAIYASAAQVVSASFSISATPSAASSGAVVIYLVRGTASLNVDTPNIISNSASGGSIAGGATKDMGSYSTSAAAFVVAAVATYQNGNPTEAWMFSNTTVLTTDLDSLLTNSHSEVVGRNTTTGAVSTQPFEIVSSSTGTSGNASWALVPFLIS